MVEHDCGQIPLVRSTTDPKVLGVVTDRDIVSRLVALGRNPRQTELDAGLAHLEKQEKRFGNPDDALASLCHVLLNANEFLYVD
jgi:hypothetical protein